MKLELLTEMASSFPEVTVEPHFHKTSFRVRKKIFATLTEEPPELVIKLTDVDQSVFNDVLSENVRPVPGAWGKKGWTIVSYSNLNSEPLMDLLRTAYKTVAPKSLGNLLDD